MLYFSLLYFTRGYITVYSLLYFFDFICVLIFNYLDFTGIMSCFFLGRLCNRVRLIFSYYINNIYSVLKWNFSLLGIRPDYRKKVRFLLFLNNNNPFTLLLICHNYLNLQLLNN